MRPDTHAGMLATITGERPPCVETTMNVKEGKKLYDFVKWYAYSLGYRIGGIDGLVYVQSTCMHEGVKHNTRHWQHVTRKPQPGTPAPLPLHIISPTMLLEPPNFWQLHSVHPEVNIMKTSLKPSKRQWSRLRDWRMAHSPATACEWQIEKHFESIERIKRLRIPQYTHDGFLRVSSSGLPPGKYQHEDTSEHDVLVLVAKIEQLRERRVLVQGRAP